jgi:hypothetical protein
MKTIRGKSRYKVLGRKALRSYNKLALKKGDEHGVQMSRYFAKLYW